MEGSSKSRLGRFLNRLRGEHHKYTVDKGISFTSSVMSESTECSVNITEDEVCASTPVTVDTNAESPDDRFAPNFDLRYGGQYMTAEQLPEFCDQLHHLVEVIRNIQAYAHITGEYPAELERRLECEARSVSALAGEARHARDVIARTRLQRRAVRALQRELHDQLDSLRDIEVRELESTVRTSDRKLFKTWESLKDSNDPAAFEPLLEEIRNKQTALECLTRLIEGRRAFISKSPLTPHPLPPPMPKDNEESSAGVGRKRREQRRAGKRRRQEPRSVPLSTEPSSHTQPLPQVTLFIQGSDAASHRTNSVPITPLELPSGGSVRDILFFTTNTV